MADFPSLPLWTDAYVADTLDLDLTDHGLYLLMMMIAWRRPDCALPDDMKWLKRSLQASAAGLHGHTFNARVPRLLERFWTYLPPEKEGQKVGKWFQKRLQKERKYLANKSETQRKRAQKRWENKDLDDATAMRGRNAPTPTPIPEEGKPSSGSKRARRLPADWELPKEWNEWARAHGIKAPSETAAKFKDYWVAKAGKDGAKLDWLATWRNWCRNEKGFKANGKVKEDFDFEAEKARVLAEGEAQRQAMAEKAMAENRAYMRQVDERRRAGG